LTLSLFEVIKALLTYLLTFLLFKVGIFGYRKSPRERAALSVKREEDVVVVVVVWHFDDFDFDDDERE